MINKEKVMIMTKAAMEENRSGKRKRPAVDYFPEDYVGFQVIKGLVGVTILYVIVVACWGLYTADVWMVSYTFPQLWDMFIRLLMLYGVVMIVSAVILVLVYSLRYYQAKTMVKEEEFQLRKLSRYYEREERTHGE